VAEEQSSPIEQAPQTQEQLHGDQAPAPAEALLTQGMRVFFQRLQSQQQEQDAAREQGLGR
jgi:hypothetical protein